jgi:hypothetical protein
MTGLRISNATREFHFKININQDTRIYVSIRTRLDIDLNTWTVKDFPELIFIFLFFIVFYLVFILFVLQHHIDYT